MFLSGANIFDEEESTVIVTENVDGFENWKGGYFGRNSTTEIVTVGKQKLDLGASQ